MQQFDVVIPVSKKDINSLPSTTGVYVFYQKNTILYIGKAINLKARLLSHWESAKIDAKEAGIVNNSDTIKCIVVDSEFKALLLESQLIQKHLPKYNSIWKDNKSYLYIKIAIKDTYPRIHLTRRELDGKSRYFGPFPSIRSTQEILREIRKVIPFCTQKNLSSKPCFYSKIGMCKPCPNVIDKVQDQAEKKRLIKEYRQNIFRVMRVLEGKTDAVLKNLYTELKSLTKHEHYEEALLLRNKIGRFEYLVNQRIFSANIAQQYNQSDESIESLLRLLHTTFPELETINRMECYDVSNFAGREATASMVVFNSGLINKDQYRRFKIKNEKLQSDFEMMEEVFRRRFKNDWTLPDLIIVDGGKPQVKLAQKVFADLKVSIPFVGIAKHPDRLVLGIDGTPTIRPSVHNLGFNLIRHMRDESHRFAKKYHVFLRNKKLMV